MAIPGSIERLDYILRQLAPIDGVSVGEWSDRETWRIDFAPEATPQQVADATAALAAFDQFDAVAEDNFTKDRKIDALDIVALKGLFNHENRLRVLEARPTITLADFKSLVRQVLDQME